MDPSWFNEFFTRPIFPRQGENFQNHCPWPSAPIDLQTFLHRSQRIVSPAAEFEGFAHQIRQRSSVTLQAALPCPRRFFYHKFPTSLAESNVLTNRAQPILPAPFRSCRGRPGSNLRVAVFLHKPSQIWEDISQDPLIKGGIVVGNSIEPRKKPALLSTILVVQQGSL